MMNRREFLAASAGVALATGRLADPRRLLAATEARSVRGRVAAGSRALPGVLVSDGCRVVRTGDDGRYELPVGPDSGHFVFVTTPRGYWSNAFYVPLSTALSSGRADFTLRPVDQPESFDFVFITDMHLDSRKFGIPKVRASLREIQELRPKPALLWAQGDICLQGKAGKEYLECLADVKIPVRNGPGNHEMLLEHKNPRGQFEQMFGPTYYSFDWAGIHAIVLDGNKPIPGLKDWKAVHGAVEGSELAWLRADLAAQPEGKPIVVGVHIPVVSTYPERREKSPEDAPYWEITNHEAITRLLARHRVRLVLQGHMHENERTTVDGVEYVESISLSGSWYQGGAGMERGVDGTPRGYRIVSVRGDKIVHRYRSSCESRVDRQGEFLGLGGRIRASRQAEFVLNCYDAPNGSTAQARIDQGAWQPMPAFAAINRSVGLKMPHHFRLVADTTALGPGRHTVEARVTWPDGTAVTEQETFEVGG